MFDPVTLLLGLTGMTLAVRFSKALPLRLFFGATGFLMLLRLFFGWGILSETAYSSAMTVTKYLSPAIIILGLIFAWREGRQPPAS